MLEDSLDGVVGLHHSEDAASGSARAEKGVEPKHALQQGGPLGTFAFGLWLGLLRVRRDGILLVGVFFRDDFVAPGCGGSEDAVVGEHVEAWWGDLCGETRKEGHGVHDDAVLAVAPSLLESVDDVATWGEVDSVLGEGRSGDVAEEPFSFLGRVGSDVDGGVQGVALVVAAEILAAETWIGWRSELVEGYGWAADGDSGRQSPATTARAESRTRSSDSRPSSAAACEREDPRHN